MLFSTQIGIPLEQVTNKLKDDHIKRAKEYLYNQADSGKKGFEPIKRGGVDKIPTISFEEEDRRKANKITY